MSADMVVLITDFPHQFITDADISGSICNTLEVEKMILGFDFYVRLMYWNKSIASVRGRDVFGFAHLFAFFLDAWCRNSPIR